jgi:hypothetical protein
MVEIKTKNLEKCYAVALHGKVDASCVVENHSESN